MTITLGWGSFCGLLTVLVWVLGIYWPSRAPQGWWDIEAMFHGFVRSSAVMVATLAIWLVYFAALR